MKKSDLNVLLNFLDDVELSYRVSTPRITPDDHCLEVKFKIKELFKNDFMIYFHSWCKNCNYHVRCYSLEEIDDEYYDYEFLLKFF